MSSPQLLSPSGWLAPYGREAQFRTFNACFAHEGRQFPAYPRARADTVVGQRGLMMCFLGRARLDGAMRWATRQGGDDQTRVDHALSLEILARKVGSHNWDVAIGGRYHEGYDKALFLFYALTRAKGGVQAHARRAILHVITWTFRDCWIPHQEECTTSFKEGRMSSNNPLRSSCWTYLWPIS